MKYLSTTDNPKAAKNFSQVTYSQDNLRSLSAAPPPPPTLLSADIRNRRSLCRKHLNDYNVFPAYASLDVRDRKIKNLFRSLLRK